MPYTPNLFRSLFVSLSGCTGFIVYLLMMHTLSFILRHCTLFLCFYVYITLHFSVYMPYIIIYALMANGQQLVLSLRRSDLHILQYLCTA